MNKISIFWVCSFLLLLSCACSDGSAEMEQWKAEVVKTENAFNELANKEGMAKAFQAFAAEEGVIKRGNEIIKGKQAIGNWYVKNGNPNATLTWEPDFVDVSRSGDMAYTYGSFVFKSVDSVGATTESKGKFHTVWKKQNDGSWKFVWD